MQVIRKIVKPLLLKYSHIMCYITLKQRDAAVRMRLWQEVNVIRTLSPKTCAKMCYTTTRPIGRAYPWNCKVSTTYLRHALPTIT